MPDQCPFKSKFLTQIRSLGPSAAEREDVLEALSAWHDNQSQTQTKAREPRAAATNECLKVSRQLRKHFDNECMHPLPSSAFNSVSRLSELITEPLVSGTKYHHVTDGY